MSECHHLILGGGLTITELKVVLHSDMCGFILKQESAFEALSELVTHCSS